MLYFANDFRDETGKCAMVMAKQLDADAYCLYASEEFFNWMHDKLFTYMCRYERLLKHVEDLQETIRMQNMTITELTAPTTTGCYSGT